MYIFWKEIDIIKLQEQFITVSYTFNNVYKTFQNIQQVFSLCSVFESNTWLRYQKTYKTA